MSVIITFTEVNRHRLDGPLSRTASSVEMKGKRPQISSLLNTSRRILGTDFMKEPCF